MAEIRYSGVPTKMSSGLGAGLQGKWANFALAELPMGLIKSTALPGAGAAGGDRKQLIAALMKLLKEEEDDIAASGAIPSLVAGG